METTLTPSAMGSASLTSGSPFIDYRETVTHVTLSPTGVAIIGLDSHDVAGTVRALLALFPNMESEVCMDDNRVRLYAVPALSGSAYVVSGV